MKTKLAGPQLDSPGQTHLGPTWNFKQVIVFGKQVILIMLFK